MRFELPSTKSLLVFEAAARHQSLLKAADELSVTPSALSKQLQSLEEQVGIKLFLRFNRQLILTEKGRHYAEQVRRILHDLREVTQALNPQQGPQDLRLLAPPSFSAYSLLPQLHAFNAHHPDVALSLLSFDGVDVPDFEAEGADAAVVLFEGSPDERFTQDPVFHSNYFVPALAPRLLAGGHILQDARELARYTWLKNRHLSSMWDVWLNAAGVPDLKPANVLWFDNGHTMAEAAISGMGVMMASGAHSAPPSYFAPDRLVPAHLLHVPTDPLNYYLLMPRRQARRGVAQAFRNWLLDAFNPGYRAPRPG